MDDKLFEALLYILQTYGLDYSSTLRMLTTFRPDFLVTESPESAASLEKLLGALTSSPNSCDLKSATNDWLMWLEQFRARIELDADEWNIGRDDWLAIREKDMKNYNPRFVLRQWVMEDLIKKLQDDPKRGKPILLKV